MASTLLRHANMENIAVRRGSVQARARSILRSLRRSRKGRPIVTSRIVQVPDILCLLRGGPPHPWRVLPACRFPANTGKSPRSGDGVLAAEAKTSDGGGRAPPDLQRRITCQRKPPGTALRPDTAVIAAVAC